MSPRSWYALAGITLAIVAVVLWMRDPDPGLLVECGHHGPGPLVESALIDPIKDVPEFHDCQRFIVDVERVATYDSLFAIYASASLPSLIRQLGEPLKQDAVTVVGTGNVATELADLPGIPRDSVRSLVATTIVFSAPHKLVAVGLIVAGNDYDALGIKPGVNCLYVGRYDLADGIPESWFAVVLNSVSGPEANCSETDVTQIDPARSKRLQVTRVIASEFTADSDYPPVARWDWDVANRQQYIGIACGAAWCEVGEAGFLPSAALPVVEGLTSKQRRVRTVKGWYDQQFLAKKGPAGKLVPSGVLGTIVADPDLGSKEDADFEAGYVPVARVYLASPGTPDAEALEEYQSKFAFVPQSSLEPDGARVLTLKGKRNETKWNARIRKSDFWFPPIKYKSKDITRRPVRQEFIDAGYEVPAVARWRWMKKDEGTWTRCSAGCCEMSQ